MSCAALLSAVGEASGAQLPGLVVEYGNCRLLQFASVVASALKLAGDDQGADGIGARKDLGDAQFIFSGSVGGCDGPPTISTATTSERRNAPLAADALW